MNEVVPVISLWSKIAALVLFGLLLATSPAVAASGKKSSAAKQISAQVSSSDDDEGDEDTTADDDSDEDSDGDSSKTASTDDDAEDKPADTGRQHDGKSGGKHDASDGAKLVVSYERGKTKETRELGKILKDAKIFEAFAEAVSETFILPQELPVIFTDCGEENAFYDPESKRILMCYELINGFFERFGKETKDSEELGVKVVGAAVFVFLHELGHALVHQLNIPITGREEDAVDDLASLILLDDDDEGDGAQLISAAAEHFGSLADDIEDIDEIAASYYDEHSFNGQRTAEMECLIYGSDPESYKDMVGEDGIPKEYADRCPEEYQKKKKSWEQLLSGHVRT